MTEPTTTTKDFTVSLTFAEYLYLKNAEHCKECGHLDVFHYEPSYACDISECQCKYLILR